MDQEEQEGVILGNLVRKYRLKRKEMDDKWTIKYVAEEANLTYNQLSKLENGKIKYPYYFTIVSIIDVLGINLSDFWEEYAAERYPNGFGKNGKY